MLPAHNRRLAFAESVFDRPSFASRGASLMSASSLPPSGLVRMNPPVFYFAATFILLFGLVVIAVPEQAGAWPVSYTHLTLPTKRIV